MKTPFNRYLYLGFILLGIYQVIALNSPLTAASSLGIALAFDPFDPSQPWQDRPKWQKAILILHLILVAGLFGYGLGWDAKS